MRDTWHTGNRYVGREVVVLERAASTNTLALDDGRPGIAYLADEQTAGRGTHGRVWQAPPRSSVLLSVVVPPGVGRAVVLTAWAAVCVAETARRLTGVGPRIKWPNDVQLNGKKVAGILIERTGGRPFVAGIGLNVRQTEADLLAAGLPDATSLRAQGADVATDDVARLLLTMLDEAYGRLLDEGEGPLEVGWLRHLGLVGREARAECAGVTHEGRIIQMGFESGVTLDTPAGRVTLAPEGILRLTGTAG